MISDYELERARRVLHTLDPQQKERVLALLEERDRIARDEEARNKFLPYVNRVWPNFISGAHHAIMAEAFEKVAAGEVKRLIIDMPPRFSKSEFASRLLPSWFLGKFPGKKIIQVSNTESLAAGFGRQVRNILGGEGELNEKGLTPFQEIFPNIALAKDSQAAAEWATNKGGSYFAVGVNGKVTGKGADIAIVDDLHSEQEAKQAESNPAIFDGAYDWYTSGIRQRLQPGGSIIIVMCVAEGERVLMGNGTWKPIEQVEVGDKVIGYEDGKPVPKTVTAAIPQGEDDIIEVVSRSCTLKVNRRHPFLVVRGGLSTSARTQEELEQARDWTLEWVPAGELKPNDVVVTMKAMALGNGHRPMPFKGTGHAKQLQMTQDDYWLFGFMFGDGWLASTKARGHTGICIATSDKPWLNEMVLEKAKRRWGVDFYETKFGYVRCDNTALARWLAEKGFGSGATKKRVPEWVFRLRNPDKRAFLEGFFHADGWHRPSTRSDTWYVGLANRALVDDLRLLARTCGVKTTKIYEQHMVRQAPNSPAPKMSHTYSARFSMKQEKVEMRMRYKNQGQGGLGRYFRFEEIEAINPAGRANVYDITVEGAESFVAEGFVVHNTRWSKRDLVGKLMSRMEDDIRSGAKPGTFDKWDVIELPAILDEGLPTERSMWPGFWSLEELQATRNALPVSKWSAQYQQNPVSSEGAIIKREYWRKWGVDTDLDLAEGRSSCPGPQHIGAWKNLDPPACDYIIMSLDTALKKNQRADYSAFTTWGIFKAEDQTTGKTVNNIILLSSYKARMEFPELKRKVKQFYEEDQPDTLLIEDKGSGISLIQELRSMGIPVEAFGNARGSKGMPNDKIARANMVADIFASGYVWAPDRRFSDELIIECAEFPGGSHDDLLDSTVQAMLRFRAGGFIRTSLDEEEDDAPSRYTRARMY